MKTNLKTMFLKTLERCETAIKITISKCDSFDALKEDFKTICQLI